MDQFDDGCRAREITADVKIKEIGFKARFVNNYTDLWSFKV